MSKELLINYIQNNLPTSRKTLDEIVEHFEERTFSKNDYFLKEGQISNDYFFLANGFMRSFTYDIEGDEVTTAFYSANRFVFECSSFFLRTTSTENIQAVTDCVGYTISFEDLNKLFHSIPEFREFGRSVLVKEFSAFKQRTLSMINRSAEERYANLITTNKEIFQYAQLKHIASFLGMTDTSLSRIRKEFLKK
ncbi:Probable cAMP-binding protein [Flavobacterium indicum GPTSA100-9 = DSM 17447]|uniref:Probable cAMP-binding protein n=1 Tax=Flavobacterium indicum (strain DSM 17447 / CIP 109464 / GPTSA100-9) TaxID=1094466 RepID=H8XTN8_FLAIG|nr:Crp/Fnr family transcriptional regulator [Flavobacterium indicum]CCG53618.1 Probable cAMP-binding protein [Flavobacterium indicum GPTSA100-9 = DSM 17447]